MGRQEYGLHCLPKIQIIQPGFPPSRVLSWLSTSFLDLTDCYIIRPNLFRFPAPRFLERYDTQASFSLDIQYWSTLHRSPTYSYADYFWYSRAAALCSLLFRLLLGAAISLRDINSTVRSQMFFLCSWISIISILKINSLLENQLQAFS